MSVVVALQKNGVVYMGCDTQTSSGKDKENHCVEQRFKIKKCENGLLVGACGQVACSQMLLADPSVFTVDGDGLTKKHIVNVVLPKIKSFCKKNGFMKDGEMECAFTLAYKDKLFLINSNFYVTGVTDCCANGSGRVFTSALANKTLSARDRILNALRESAARSSGVSNPFVLIDTKELKYELVEG